MSTSLGKTLAVIPARGGSKSIPKKNITPFLGRPLIEHVIEAAKRAKHLDAVVCSTDDEEIAEVATRNGVAVSWRPAELAQDATPVLDVLAQIIRDDPQPIDIIPLLQPTSPFMLPEHIDACVEALMNDVQADSAQTVAHFAHNHHAYNQRVVEDGHVRFRFVEERRAHYNKQTKPVFFVFGNLVATRARTVIEKHDVFGDVSVAKEVPEAYAFDLDGPLDIEYGEFLVERGRVTLPWL